MKAGRLWRVTCGWKHYRRTYNVLAQTAGEAERKALELLRGERAESGLEEVEAEATSVQLLGTLDG